MLNKVAFLCVNPWESFLPVTFQSYSKHYYEWIKEMAVLKNVELHCREYIERYGVFEKEAENVLFPENCDNLQLLYVQSARKDLLEQIFQTADIIIMGLPGSRKEFDKIYMSVFPWINEILFLWGKHTGKDAQYVDRLVRECMLKKEQLIEIGEESWQIFGLKKAPAFLREPQTVL